MPSIIRPAMAKYKMRILVFSTRIPPRFCIKMALIASVALITPSAVETERTCTTPRTIFNKIIPNSVEPIARKTSMVTTATNAFGAVAYSKNCATIIANAKSISVRPEKRSINLYENKMTGSSTIVLKNSTVPTAPVGMPSSCNKMGLYVILRFEQPEKTNPMMTNKMYIGAQRNENCLPAAAFAASVSVNEMSSVPRKPTMASTAETETETKISCGLVNSIMAQAADPDADLRICWENAGYVCVGAVSLLPKDHFHGMRRDVVEAMKDLGIKVLRWPGGNFAGEFNWMDGLLPADMRAPFQSYLGLETQPHTMGYDFSEMNTDDFIALCREIGAEPFITINPCWNTPDENAAWVEYCNGDVSTPYGKLRANRGHQEPYNVQFWSLGNEFGYGHMEGDNTPAGYCQIALENGKKMLEASPGLSLCSSGPYPNKEWAEFSAKPLAGISQMISQHYYGYDPHYTDLSTVEEEYNRCMASVSRMRELIHQSRQWLEPSIRISMDEWNVWYAWYRPSSVTDGIYAALVLHMLMEEAEKSGIALACHFQAINEGMLCVKPNHVSLTAQGQVFSWMNRWHMGNRLCSASQEAVITVDREGRVSATVVNAAFHRKKPVDFSSFGPCSEAVLFSSDTVLPPSSFTQSNVLDQAAGGTLQMPPHSVLFLRF